MRRCFIRPLSARTTFLVLLNVIAFVHAMHLLNAAEIKNLALTADASATSEHNAQYLAKFAIDGRIPGAGSRGEDLSAAWCVLQSEAQNRADFTLTWKEPVEVGQIAYWGRTAWMLTECWKDYEVYLDDAAEPVAHGSFAQKHGPQQIDFPISTVRKITLRFLNSHGGMNPGAAEIQVFPRRLTTSELRELAAANNVSMVRPPGSPDVNAETVRDMVVRLEAIHGEAIPEAERLLQRIDAASIARDGAEIENNPEAISDAQDELLAIERDALLFDVDWAVAIKRHEINASHVYTYHYEGFHAGGALCLINLQDPDSEPVELVASSEGQILDADLSHDGNTILFSWRQQEDDGYHLWQINVDGSGLKQLTEGYWHDYNACWLPDGTIAFLSSRAPQFAYCWHAPVGILYRMAPDGSSVVKLSANYLNDFTPAVLSDGRIIYSRWEYVDRPAIPIQSLWTINPDGTNLSAYFGNRVLSPGTFMEPQSVPGTSLLLCTMTGHNGPTRGAIGLIDRRKGLNTQEAITNLTPDTPIQNVDQGNGNTGGSKQYSGPYPLDAERFLCSMRGPVLIRTMDGLNQSIAHNAPTDGMQYLNVRPVRERSRPPILGTVDSEDAYDAYEALAAGREATRFATLYLQDVYNGLGPDVKPGDVAAIRIVREMQKTVRIDPGYRAFGFQFPVISCGATYAGKTVLGDIPVDADGSACFNVPAGMPLYFIALDNEGRAIQRMRSFTHLMPGETQGCIGCHEHRLQGPRNTSTRVFADNPVEPVPPEWGVRGFDYSRIVQPVLNQYCVECHDPLTPPNGLDLSGDKTDFFSVSYDVLARENQGAEGTPYVSWIPTYNGQEQNILKITPRYWGSYSSRLADVVRTGHPDADGEPRFQMDDVSKRRIYAWIDLNVPYYGSSETAHPELVGCRQVYPDQLDAVLLDVAQRRCAECHSPSSTGNPGWEQQQGRAVANREVKIPRRVWTRVTTPELNAFLTAPLAESAGGTERCGRAVFADTNDPDYRAILETFTSTTALLDETPRMDMEGGVPAPDVCRDTQ
jgi:hypothetical protein